MIEILQLPLGPLGTNCYIVGCDETMKAAIIDPAWNGPAIMATADERGWKVTHILLTHSHFDHVGGLAIVKEVAKAPIYIHPDAVAMLSSTTMSAALVGLKVPAPPPPDEMLTDGQVLHVGRLALHTLYTPGHAPGHVCFHVPAYGVVFSGDLLFQRGIGRTDLPGGDPDRLLQSIKEALFVLPDETQVFSGHGEPTTIGEERQENPWLSAL